LPSVKVFLGYNTKKTVTWKTSIHLSPNHAAQPKSSLHKHTNHNRIYTSNCEAMNCSKPFLLVAKILRIQTPEVARHSNQQHNLRNISLIQVQCNNRNTIKINQKVSASNKSMTSLITFAYCTAKSRCLCYTIVNCNSVSAMDYSHKSIYRQQQKLNTSRLLLEQLLE